LTGDGASQVQAVAVGWSVYSIHHRAFDLGLVGIVMFALSLLLVFVAGHAVDRYDRKGIVLAAAIAEAICSLVLAAAIAEAICSLVLAALAFAHVRELLAYLGVLFLIGIARAFGSPAENTILVNLVEADAYMRVQSRYSSLREIVVIAGPALGGALVAVSQTAAFAVAGAMTLVSVAAFVLVHVSAMERGSEDELDAGSALDGVRFIVSRPIILGAISLDLFAVLFGGAVALLPMYADQILHVGAFGFGLLRSAGGLGACTMALVLSQRPPRTRVGRTLLAAVAGYGLAMFVFAYSRDLRLSIAALAAAGALDMISVVIRTALVQLNTPDAMRGRVNAVEGVFVGASGQVGAFESGTLAQFVGPVAAVAIGGAAVLAVVGSWALAFPALRRSNRLDGET
jgi:hypothetical protein